MTESTSQFRLVFSFAAVGHFLFHVIVALHFTIVLRLERVWDMAFDELIALWTPGALLLGLAAPLGGWLGDRFGAARLMTVYYIGIGIASVLCGIAQGAVSLTVYLALMGLFGAIYHPVGTAWLVAHANRSGKALALLGIAGGLGAALAAVIAAALMEAISWRAAFALPGAVAVAAGLALASLIARGRLSGAVRTLEQPSSQLSTHYPRKLFIILASAMSLTTVMYHAFTVLLPKWFALELPTYLPDGLIAVGAVVSAVYLIGGIAQLLGGHLADLGHARRIYVASFALKAAVFVAAGWISGLPVVAAAICIVFAFDLAAPVENVLIARYSPENRRGLAYGLRNGIAIVAAPAGVQLTAILYTPVVGFQPLFITLAAIAGLVFFIAYGLPGERQVRQAN